MIRPSPYLAALLLLWLTASSAATSAFASVQAVPELAPVDCWFEIGHDWPRTECFRMYVPENHARPDGRVISFPVIRFGARFSLWPDRPPVLHLGGGGPGGSMYLDSGESVRTIWEYHDALSLQQRRDLIVIDPRGAGLSEPVLVCHRFLQNLGPRLEQNLSMRDEWLATLGDYADCVDDYRADGVDLGQYNSRAVTLDVELLRQALAVDRWILLGVSYATIYAQLVARAHPERVEAMLLDSATFPNLAGEQGNLQRVLAPYRALFDFCRFGPDCAAPLPDYETRFWALYRALNRDPIAMTVAHPYTGEQIDLVLNGERLLGVLLEGIYGVGIYRDLPAIISELELRRTWRLRPYLESTLTFMFDPGYGDVSMEAHYCFDMRPYIDLEHYAQQVAELPPGYFREMLQLSLDIGDSCDEMGIVQGYPPMAEGRAIDVPTLFLHGEFDPVTLLDDVLTQREYFSHHRLVTFDHSHSMFTSDACAEVVAARFVKDPSISEAGLSCE